jgi:hypothetical protein
MRFQVWEVAYILIETFGVAGNITVTPPFPFRTHGKAEPLLARLSFLLQIL